MEMQVKLPNGTFIKLYGDSDTDLFESWAHVHEIFAEEKCALCGCTKLRPVVRVNADDDKFYELHCQGEGCYARLTYGQNKKGDTLFPRRKLTKDGKPDLSEGEFGKHQGWTKFRGDKKLEPAANGTKR